MLVCASVCVVLMRLRIVFESLCDGALVSPPFSFVPGRVY